MGILDVSEWAESFFDIFESEEGRSSNSDRRSQFRMYVGPDFDRSDRPGEVWTVQCERYGFSTFSSMRKDAV